MFLQQQVHLISLFGASVYKSQKFMHLNTDETGHNPTAPTLIQIQILWYVALGLGMFDWLWLVTLD